MHRRARQRLAHYIMVNKIILLNKYEGAQNLGNPLKVAQILERAQYNKSSFKQESGIMKSDCGTTELGIT